MHMVEHVRQFFNTPATDALSQRHDNGVSFRLEPSNSLRFLGEPLGELKCGPHTKYADSYAYSCNADPKRGANYCKTAE
jgi:hypothetical protein